MTIKKPTLRRIAPIQAKLDFGIEDLYFTQHTQSFECWYLDAYDVKKHCIQLDITNKSRNDIEWDNYTWYKVENH